MPEPRSRGRAFSDQPNPRCQPHDFLALLRPDEAAGGGQASRKDVARRARTARHGAHQQAQPNAAGWFADAGAGSKNEARGLSTRFPSTETPTELRQGGERPYFILPASPL